jgi:hypothetical protein
VVGSGGWFRHLYTRTDTGAMRVTVGPPIEYRVSPVMTTVGYDPNGKTPRSQHPDIPAPLIRLPQRLVDFATPH